MRPGTLTAFSCGVAAGGLLAAAVLFAVPAKADPDNAAIAYTAAFGGAVCDTLDDYPTFNGILGIGKAIIEDGLTAEQAGGVIALSITDICPRHTGLLVRFINTYGQDAVA